MFVPSLPRENEEVCTDPFAERVVLYAEVIPVGPGGGEHVLNRGQVTLQGRIGPLPTEVKVICCAIINLS